METPRLLLAASVYNSNSSQMTSHSPIYLLLLIASVNYARSLVYVAVKSL